MTRDVINIDIDGVLTNSECHWEETPTVNKETRRFVQDAYYSMKYVIIIHTARLWHDANKTIGWLVTNDIPFHGIMMEKGASDVYLDDKAINPTKEDLRRLLTEKINIPACGVRNNGDTK